MKISKNEIVLASKGFAMGMADIVPGVSGGTIALITGIYNELIASISSVNKDFIQLVLKLKIKEALDHLNFKFLLPLFLGIGSAILIMSRLMHYFMNNYPVYTWSLFFGLILSSIFFVFKMIPNAKAPKNLFFVALGIIVGYAVVSLIPVQTPDTLLMVFFAGCVGICAMILPGISGSFILLILGKYLYVTSALKNPLDGSNLVLIIVFCSGCLIGLLSFSKLLNYLLKNFYPATMSVLTGFMIGSLKKIWPWKEVLESKVISGKVRVLRDANILPSEFNGEFILAILCMIIGVLLIFILERLGDKS